MSDATPTFDRRRVLGLLGAGLGTVALGACGRGTGEGTASTAGTTATTADGAATAAAGAAGGPVTAAMFTGGATCRATVEQIEGPYHIDVDKIRGDIREDRDGTRLRVAARVVDVDGCTPIEDAVFEIWHCDAGGLYSGFEAASTGRGGGRGVTDDERYLRGAQVTNADGIAVLTTVYPGWYSGRSVHIHAKVALTNTELLTTQLYFDDAVTDEVHRAAPYAARSGRRTRNADDGFFASGPTLTVTEDGDGYLGLITIGVEA